MKEFEKWLRQIKFPHLDPKKIGSTIQSEYCGDAWKAALEWVLSRVRHTDADENIIEDVIKELND